MLYDAFAGQARELMGLAFLVNEPQMRRLLALNRSNDCEKLKMTHFGILLEH